MQPIDDGNYKQWTPNTGERWAAVDELPPDDDVTYIQEDTTNERNSFTFGTFGFPGQIRINNLQVIIRAKKTSGGAPSQIEPFYREGGTDYDNGTSYTLGTSYEDCSPEEWTYTTNPVTGEAWTTDEIDGMQWGVIATATGKPINVTQFKVLVDFTPIGSYEDFSTFTEEDPEEWLTVTTTKVTTEGYTTEPWWLTKSYGAGHFGDFEHLGEFYIVDGAFMCWSIADDYHTRQAMDDNNNGIRCELYFGTAYFKDETNASQDSGSYDTSTLLYYKVERSSTTGTFRWYTDAARSNLVDTLTITTGEDTYEYLNAIGSPDGGDGGWCDGYVQNIDIQEEEEEEAFIPKIIGII